jgi:hypothetical protein
VATVVTTAAAVTAVRVAVAATSVAVATVVRVAVTTVTMTVPATTTVLARMLPPRPSTTSRSPSRRCSNERSSCEL